MFGWLKKLFSKKPARVKSRSTVSVGEKVGNVIIATPDQLNKHTEFKVGESYTLGDATVTLHANKASVLRKIALIDARRIARLQELTERGERIMLMNPEELIQFKLDEWTQERRAFQAFTEKLTNGTLEAPPAGSKEERVHKQFLKIMEQVKQRVP